MRVAQSLVGILLWSLASSLMLLGSCGADPPGKQAPSEDAKKLNDLIEKSVNLYDVLPAADSRTLLVPQVVLRWRNVIRGQEAEDILVVWPHNGRPVAMASIFPWQGKICHEFDSLCREKKVIARDKDQVIWSPETAGVEFKEVPAAPKPAKTPAERLRQMKGIAERFKATMTGWQADDRDQEQLRLLPRPLYRYESTKAKDPDPNLLDGAMFAYVQGTDPEVVLLLEAIGTVERSAWQYAFARATSGGLEVKLGREVVWTATKTPDNRTPTLPHFTMQRVPEKSSP